MPHDNDGNYIPPKKKKAAALEIADLQAFINAPVQALYANAPQRIFAGGRGARAVVDGGYPGAQPAPPVDPYAMWDEPPVPEHAKPEWAEIKFAGIDNVVELAQFADPRRLNRWIDEARQPRWSQGYGPNDIVDAWSVKFMEYHGCARRHAKWSYARNSWIFHPDYDLEAAWSARPLGVEPPEPDIPYDTYTKRGEATPRFFIHYDTPEEYRLRLQGTYISYKDAPVYVARVEAGMNGTILFQLTDHNKKVIIASTPDALPDLNARTFEAQYLDLSHEDYSVAAFMARYPARVYQQGINEENTQLYSNGLKCSIHGFGRDRFLRGLTQSKKITPFDPELLKTLDKSFDKCGGAAIRLSKNFALGQTVKGVELRFKEQLMWPLEKGWLNLVPKLPSVYFNELKELNIPA